MIRTLLGENPLPQLRAIALKLCLCRSPIASDKTVLPKFRESPKELPSFAVSENSQLEN
ncbi:hypothetical protein QT971_15130 [Microcoleus sp. herbarium19]|uniref:hypothetical protein n=1 Tax=Microcoleus sp. herbarium13 TaxID=3055438 RepID=UPI002FD384F2